MARLLRFAAIAVATLVFPASALAGAFTLHPSGFGEHSYSAWKANQGLPDSTGNKDQALYFQKMTLTPTFAAGVAVIKGFEGQATSVLAPLSFYWREDGHCGAGAPRFNVRFQPQGTTDPLLRQTAFVGCQEMIPTDEVTDSYGRQWQQRTFEGTLPAGTIVSVAIIFDEGNDVGQGYVYLDNIQAGPHIWTSASDNSNGQTITQDPTGTDYVSSLLGEPVNVLFPSS